MKARALRKLLNDTKYLIADDGDCIAVGSAYVHDLISVNKETLKIRIALDTFNEGRKSIRNKELEMIYDRLVQLIETGEIKSIIEGQDEIENPLPVFTYRDGKVIETITDAYGYPNVTIDGKQMYNNTHFQTFEKAKDYAISEYKAGVELFERRIEAVKENLRDLENELLNRKKWIGNLKAL